MQCTLCSPSCGSERKRPSAVFLRLGLPIGDPVGPPKPGMVSQQPCTCAASTYSRFPELHCSLRAHLPGLPPGPRCPLPRCCLRARPPVGLGAPAWNALVTEQAHPPRVARGGFLPRPWGLIRCSWQRAPPGQAHGGHGTLGMGPQGPSVTEQGESHGTRHHVPLFCHLLHSHPSPPRT